MSTRYILITGIVFGGLAVALGAFGAHALEDMLEQRGRTDTWDLAVQYQMIHALALLICGVLSEKYGRWINRGALLFSAGVVCFSGSLFALCLTEVVFPLVLITPLGGTLMIAGWIALLMAVLRSPVSESGQHGTPKEPVKQ